MRVRPLDYPRATCTIDPFGSHRLLLTLGKEMKKIILALSIPVALVLVFFLITRVTIRGGNNERTELEDHWRNIDSRAFTFWVTLTTSGENPDFQLNEKKTAFLFDEREELSAVLKHPIGERKIRDGFTQITLYLFPDINEDGAFPELTKFPVGDYSLKLDYEINGKEYEVTHVANFYHKRDLKGSAFFGF